ncbi:hypothetical protein BCR33DRAFT_725480 [Rhizoclosmatium globosum]|uniref:Uncharacterized protein n=1 Tax=Rhizoclosmatium globosum TaxID=329046 RepID=A0A1Y2AYP2_9FUNG|nr:hypothetical protein BCR33DRAFT_725480 [Rhizoclosmatium globosum]|eukprot:ORY27606.1 hypothetical protein BCR33DRAFT_725480 [Rhizoclosmatium globosum]
MNYLTILPHELIRSVILHLPINKHLRSVALSSKLLFGDAILNDLTLARLHVQSLISPSVSMWEYLDDNGIKYNEWKSLPFNYKCAVYSLILAEPVWLLNGNTSHTDFHAMFHEPWRVPEEVSLQIIKTLVGVMDITSQKDRALRVAVMLGYTSTVEFLLSIEKVNPRVANEFCIITAILNNSTDIVGLLLNCDKIDLSYLSYDPFLIVCQRCNVDIVKLFLASGKVDPCAGNSSCIVSANSNDASVDVLRALLEDGRANPAGNNNRALLMALSFPTQNKEFAKVLLADPRVDPNRAIPAVVLLGWTDLLELLLKHERVDPSQVGSEAVIEAIQSGGSMNCVRLLLADSRVDPSQNDNEALLTAVQSQNKDVLGLLLRDSRVRTTESLERAVGIAKNMGDVDMVVFLSQMIEELNQKEM